MEVQAQLKNARIVPRRVRALRSVIVGLPVEEARAQLMFEVGKAAGLLDKVLKSAVANAKENHDLEMDNLMVVNVSVDEGVKFKRYRPVSKGMAHGYVKRTCHIRVVLREIKETINKKKTKKKTEVETLTVEDLEKMSRDEHEAEDDKKQEQSKRKDKDEEDKRTKNTEQRKGRHTRSYRRKSI